MRPTHSLPRALVLLALDTSAGAIRPGLHYALIAATLIECVWKGMLRREGETLAIAGILPGGDPMLDEMLALLRLHACGAELRVQVQQLAHAAADLDGRVLADFEREGIVRREQARERSIYQPARFALLRPQLQIELRADVRSAIRFASSPSDFMAALLALLEVCDLLGLALSPQEIRQARARLVGLRPADASTAWLIASVEQLFRDSEVLMLTAGQG